MALYIPHGVSHLARVLFVRPEILDPTTYLANRILLKRRILFKILRHLTQIFNRCAIVEFGETAYLGSSMVGSCINLNSLPIYTKVREDEVRYYEHCFPLRSTLRIF